METVIFSGDGVTVTDSIVSVPGGQKFFLAQLSSVRVVYESRTLGQTMSVLMICGGALVFVLGTIAAWIAAGIGAFLCFAAVAVLLCGAGALGLLLYRPMYHLVLAQSSGEARAVSLAKEAQIRAIEAAVVQAMGARR